MQPVSNPNASPQCKNAEPPSELVSLVNAVRAGRAHIVPTQPGRYQIHLGDRSTMRIGSVAIQMTYVGVSGCGMVNANDDMIETGGIKIPTSPEKIREALSYLQ